MKGDTLGRSVIILGMHRSGTSAVTRVVNLLGLPMCPHDDLYQGEHNPAGYWESATLIETNKRILKAVGTDTYHPPAPGWHRKRRALRLIAGMRRDFRSVYASEPWVWKDPRTCITLPLWRMALRWVDPIAVYVSRDPAEVVRSIGRRDRLTTLHAVALWERYTRAALLGATGMPLLHVRYRELLRDRVGSTCRIRDALDRLGADVGGSPATAALSLLGFRERADALPLSAEQQQLVQWTERLPSVTPCFSPADLPPETPSTSRVLRPGNRRSPWRSVKAHAVRVTGS